MERCRWPHATRCTEKATCVAVFNAVNEATGQPEIIRMNVCTIHAEHAIMDGAWIDNLLEE